MKQEIINKEIWKWEYFSDKDLRKVKTNKKDGILVKFILFWIKFLVPEIAFNMNGLYKVRYFEIVNKEDGKTRLLKAEEDLN